jgi:lysophospholipase
VIQHGFGDHGRRYSHVVNALNDGSTVIYAIDARGHGTSPGLRGHAGDFNHFAQDLGALVAAAQAANPGVPLFLIGHSMGGVIALDYSLMDRYQDGLRGLIISSPALRIKMTPVTRVKKFVGGKLSRILPAQVVSAGIDPQDISQDEEIIKAYKADPHVHSKISFGMGTAFFAMGDAILENAHRIHIPIYIFHGTADEICMPMGSEALYGQVASTDKTLKYYANLRHETFNERLPDRDQVLADLRAWIDRHS